ncbi:dienelactone hydrolase family protein [Paraburkholderia acidisoli]|uniref:Dienelactone hydrolase family protein n=1 Tax=Paraburkholderia acidisoli TaxID=2571748 RepID=A0A7Z2GPC7_9BURK|nr:dienelactone hydrolase family protein [Paraburkholderia acidisoli]QGZ65234.1 dienelactone hydrolase family protein [Paraburkholderia acidisoli]
MSNSNQATSVNAHGVNQTQITVEAKDGPTQVWVLTPQGEGQWPGVIFYMDAFGIRPAMIEMASHIASQGYVVLLADLFYRFGAYGPLDPKEVLKGDFRATVGPMMASTDNHKAADDTAALLAYLDSRSDVKGSKVGTVGFCMGGGMALTAAAWYPERVAAAASFHGGNLATDQPTSPHLQLPKVKAEVLVAGADNDHSYPLDMAQRFEAALTAAGVKHTSEIYEGKAHGWMKPDMPVFDAQGAERGWKELFALYARTLG